MSADIYPSTFSRQMKAIVYVFVNVINYILFILSNAF